MGNIGNRIKELREHLGISQQRLADLMGVLRVTISQIEKGGRKICAEELIKLSEIFGVEKFKEVLIYILNKIGSKPNIGETVLYKLLYFIDFDFYEKYEEQLIGATYKKNRYGPTPIEFKKIIDKMSKDKEITKIKSEYFQYPQTKYLPLRKADLSKLKANEIEVIDDVLKKLSDMTAALSKLKANEIEVIDDVLKKLSDMTAAQISEHSHNDVPWLTTKAGNVIEYEFVFYRTPPYSVREYGEDI